MRMFAKHKEREITENLNVTKRSPTNKLRRMTEMLVQTYYGEDPRLIMRPRRLLTSPQSRSFGV